MTRPVQRVGDRNSGGGIARSGHSNITVNGRLMLKKMSAVTPHTCCPLCPKKPVCCKHCSARAAKPGSTTVTANGVSVLRSGDKDTCGHRRIQGSFNVMCSS